MAINPLLIALILSILPISELRAGIPYAILNGISPITAFFLCTLANIIVIPIVFFFLDYVNDFLMNIKIWEKFFVKYVDHKVNKIKSKYEYLSYFILFLFVAIPAPGTGAYTGVLLAWFFKMKKKTSFYVIAGGVIVAGIITTILMLLGIGFFMLF